MKDHKIMLLLIITPFFLSSSFNQNRNRVTITENQWSATTTCSSVAFGSVSSLSIADMGVVEGNAGQKSVEVMVILSNVSTSPVKVAYSTRNGTASAGSDYATSTGTISFAPGEILKKITILINGDLVCEPNETFDIVLSNASGATLTDSIGTLAIGNDDCIGGGLSVYEVRLTYTGYTTFAGSPADCPIRANGKVVMTGLLSGVENVPASDDISYTGTLQLDIDIDICSATGEGDNAKLCGITAIGSGPVSTELDIYYDARGGYIKAENESGGFLQIAFGSCDQSQISEERTMIPNKTIASVFNGRDLPMLTNRTLVVGRYVETDGGNVTVVEIIRKIR